MLTRLKVSGFKNLEETEVRFGPLTCIAGYNGVGKSNLFDAIRFLSLLADHTFVDAAMKTRGGTSGDVAALFRQGGNGEMHFECDILIPRRGLDDFRQLAEATHTLLTYSLRLKLVRDQRGLERIELVNEDLRFVRQSEVKDTLAFPHSPEWRDAAVARPARRVPYIETDLEKDPVRIRLSSDNMRGDGRQNRGGGRPTDFLAADMPRTALSGAQNADESRTAVLVRAELRAWRILQLEPSALRLPDELQAPTALTSEGRHLPATLARLVSEPDGDTTLTEISNRLAQLLGEVREVRVDRDDARRVLRLVMTDRDGHEFAASSLSDGTLRFVALSVLERDTEAKGVLCLEEPENGIHPERVSAMLELLRDIAVDPRGTLEDANPLRQVIISTHSPVVVSHCHPDELVFADVKDSAEWSGRSLVVRPIADTWRHKLGSGNASILQGELHAYLNAMRTTQEGDAAPTVYTTVRAATRRGIAAQGDGEDAQLALGFGDP